ncbi:MAG TPA: primosomal protein N', partial [Flavobacterium sp.]|nr:primosomal protein N' [Flavobacterium sp.]
VIIQTYNPYHNVIRQVVANDYQGMAAEQLAERRNYHYPPFVRMIKLTLRHRDFDKLREASAWMAGVMRQQLSLPVFGPEEPPVSRIRGEFIRNIIIKIPAGYSQPEIKKTIHKIQDSFESVAAFRPVRISINVDV